MQATRYTVLYLPSLALWLIPRICNIFGSHLRSYSKLHMQKWVGGLHKPKGNIWKTLMTVKIRSLYVAPRPLR
ncbi:hypothetical protein F4821DRAFT_249698 [Hypoxylon rubiginosum]|uniref:Uncharacterized protein n=1 Tax=Hypoxylon rubiginosum TaxID=110542 RepID=A0ACC0CLL8_9PEZI|nr:hypothetical protein F4821DRAFT_249698 [Hypoxylon rubiginosum]